MSEKYDFTGYATRYNVCCADNRTIMPKAFSDCNGITVPLVYMHNHDDINNVIGHAYLEDRPDGVFAYGKFNDSPEGEAAKVRVKNGDLTGLSVYANKLKQRGKEVFHGMIREVSLVIAGANPGAYIENVSFAHSDGMIYESEDEAIIYNDMNINFLEHDDMNEFDEELEHADDSQNGGKERTIGDVIDSMNEEQKNVLYYLTGKAKDMDPDDDDEELEQSDDEGEDFMSHNIFDATEDNNDAELVHDALNAALADAPRYGSLKASLSDHLGAIQHSITDIEMLFPDAKALSNTPEFYKREPDTWVTEVWNATKKTPFSRVKTMMADITADEARAKGYTKGKKKIEEVFSLLKRSTTPQTVYKLQKLDRDDIIDITDFDVVAFVRMEMHIMLREELSRAVLVGDGRSSVAEDKIKEEHIRPIYGDDPLYTIYHKVTFAADADINAKSDALIEAAIRARKEYRGSGNPVMYASTDVITDMLLAKDGIGRRLYATLGELASALRVSKIVEVPIMEGVTRQADSKTYELLALIVNLNDYTIGADKGGAVTMFDDFDIDYNKYAYLLETRCSGALVRAKSAIALEVESAAVSG